MPYQLHIRYDLCTGCRACQIACAIHKEGSFWPEAASIRVLQVGPGPLDIPVFCHQCSDHPCVNSCPNHALETDKKGVVRVNPDLCFRVKGINCKKCVLVCPAQSVQFHPTSNLPMFCDLCQDNPQCVQVCAAGALQVTNNLSFDGKYYAEKPEQIASELCLKVYGSRSVD